MQEGKLVVVTASNPPEDLLQVADTGLAGMDYLWALALDAPNAIASTVRYCSAWKECALTSVSALVKASVQLFPCQVQQLLYPFTHAAGLRGAATQDITAGPAASFQQMVLQQYNNARIANCDARAPAACRPVTCTITIASE